METLELKDDDGVFTIFVAEITELDDHLVSADVYEVTSWEMDNSIIEKEPYLSISLKWDGCSHINIGDETGYFHLCGRLYWERHCKLMKWLYQQLSSRVKQFTPDEIWEN